MADLIGWIGNVFFIFGVPALAQKKVIGFYLNIVANLCYVLQGYLVGVPSLMVISIFLVILNIYGIVKWR